MTQASNIHDLAVTVPDEPDFDRAYRMAIRIAMGYWQVDECGHIGKFPDLERSECSVCLEFSACGSSHGMGGAEFWYRFATWIDRQSEE